MKTRTIKIKNEQETRTFGMELGAGAKAGDVIALLCGVIAMTIVMIGANMVITPIFMGVPASVVWSLMPFIAGFNAIKAGINAVVTALVYKRISGFLHKQ